MFQITQHSGYDWDLYMVLTDGRTPAVGIGASIAITIKKAGGTFGSISPTITEKGNGWYTAALVAANHDTLGNICMRAAQATCDDFAGIAQIVARPDVKGASVNDAGATTTVFITTLSETGTDFWKDCFIRFIDGALAGEVRLVTAYNGTTRAITCIALSAAPANSSKFVLVNV